MNEPTKLGVKIKSIAHVSGDNVLFTAEDAEGVEHQWLMRVGNFMQFVPTILDIGGKINKHYSDLRGTQQVVAYKAEDFNIGFVPSNGDMAMTVKIENISLHFHFAKELGNRLSQELGKLYQALPANK